MTFEVNNSPFCGTRRQVRHQPADSRAAAARGADTTSRCASRRPRTRTSSGLRPRRAAPGRAAREHAARRLRARRVAAARRHQGDRRRASASRTRSSRSTSTRARPGRGHAGARRARRAAHRHASGRQGPRAARLRDSLARPDRLPDRVPHHDLGHRASCIHIFDHFASGARPRDRPAPERRADLERRRARRSPTRCSTCRSAAG